MRSYKEIAKETGTTIADVREAMSLAEKREMPVDHYYDDYDSRISLTFSPADYGRCEVIVKTFWAIADKWGRPGNCGSGRTREETVINALNNGLRA